ncbi:hypothetical protein Ae168Ps1_2088c [Pseudonocardia sp. Ae168_Ps1]|nr:hypothetical protein Ae150APs1_2082c [Pseudonocardia sp. Ae150A_Ps1]OLL79682.1 hypothetical protein Ae168Ps1_2088c [Pseudonocardia sp. Ae168_Ps1]OLL86182.1 hypothetical protein Ae263Ps1_3237 [Pseudonocardia sp. Ae263_Ps1]OLL93787.1 hypothetical protein Ae356Ps1_3684c [Pseudonocardia sp. Ae356_Ps1]
MDRALTLLVVAPGERADARDPGATTRPERSGS